MNSNKTRGNIFIISAASGTGKTTLVSQVIQSDPTIHVSISHTTRKPRHNEQHGSNYYFVSVSEFEQMISENRFIEFAEVYNNYYGTSIADIHTWTEKGHDVILEIDIQGAEQVRRLLPKAISIFILPPSMNELESRLRNRGTDDEAVVEKRLDEARHEIHQAFMFDYIVINHEVEQATQDILHIIYSNRLTQNKQNHFLTDLLTADTAS